MNWFSLPLHGVACQPWCEHTQVEHAIQLVEGKPIVLSGEPIWQGQQHNDNSTTQVALYKNNSAYTLNINCQGKGRFTLQGNTFAIDWQPGGTPASHYFQSMGLALWLELNGVMCLHGNALSKGERTIIVLAPSGTGKSTLSGALMQQGFTLLTDDMVALYEENRAGQTEYGVYPSWPIMRLWPNSIEHVLNANESTTHKNEAFKKVHDKFEKRIVPINTKQQEQQHNKKKVTDIFLLKRVDNVSDPGHFTVTPLPGGEAVMALMQNTILGEVYRPLNLEQQRMLSLAKMAEGMKVNVITYPSGTQGLQAVTNWLAN
ncbi:hypothetical protein DRW07_03620 [Alteromonas sediminis]|uniref:HprK-related kinase B n=1 Tax=Alteromonas sediminis TaxID=2259342 RepID=A0A3N5ZB88_9ALTE|nr:hypothetical protein [Alteromonas sediminis]RPJ68504.1 hypothetical protein DRW07_03620 [Alteromonas sediminis]